MMRINTIAEGRARPPMRQAQRTALGEPRSGESCRARLNNTDVGCALLLVVAQHGRTGCVHSLMECICSLGASFGTVLANPFPRLGVCVLLAGLCVSDTFPADLMDENLLFWQAQALRWRHRHVSKAFVRCAI